MKTMGLVRIAAGIAIGVVNNVIHAANVSPVILTSFVAMNT
jgi:hypothetical protein